MNRHKITLHDLDLPLFSGISDQIVNEWDKIATIYTLYPEQKLYQHGNDAKAFYMILSGGVRVVEYTPEGKAVTVKVYGQGDIIGLLSLTLKHRHTGTVEAVKESRIVSFRSDEARDLLEKYGEIAMRLVDCLTQHVNHAHDRIRNLAAEKTEKRLARALLHFHHKFGHIEDNVYVIDAELSQRDISEFTGTTLETVNRYLRKWEEHGWIRLSYKHVDILQPYELEQIAASISQHGYMPE